MPPATPEQIEEIDEGLGKYSLARKSLGNLERLIFEFRARVQESTLDQEGYIPDFDSIKAKFAPRWSTLKAAFEADYGAFVAHMQGIR